MSELDYTKIPFDDTVIVNSADITPLEIIAQMNESRPLPMGSQEFDAWAQRILSGSLLPCTDRESMIFALASMIMHLGPTESHKPDAFFIHSLRKSACNQIAHAKATEIKLAHEARKKIEEEKAKLDQPAETEVKSNLSLV